MTDTTLIDNRTDLPTDETIQDRTLELVKEDLPGYIKALERGGGKDPEACAQMLTGLRQRAAELGVTV